MPPVIYQSQGRLGIPLTLNVISLGTRKSKLPVVCMENYRQASSPGKLDITSRIQAMALSIPTHLSFCKPPIPDYSLFFSEFSHLSIRPKPIPRKFTVIRMGGGPRTYPGGVSRWQWKRMQAKKAKQLLKARLSRERQIYEMRKRAELKAAVADLERPWEVVDKAPTLFSVSADEQVKVLADRFQKPGGFDLWTERDGPQLFKTHDGIPSARFFPKGVVHSVKPYGKVAGLDDPEDAEFGAGSDGEIGVERDGLKDRRGESDMNRHGRRRRFRDLNFPEEESGLEDGNSSYSRANSGVNRNVLGRRESENSKYSSANSGVNRNVVGRRESENLKYSAGNSTVSRNGGEMRSRGSRRFGNSSEGLSSDQVVHQRNVLGRRELENSKYSSANSGVNRNVVGRRESENLKYSGGNSAVNRNDGEMRTRESWRFENSGEGLSSGQVVYQRNLSGSKSSNRSSGRFQNNSGSRIQNNGGVGGQGFVNSRNVDSGNYDLNFQSQVKHRGSTMSSRRENRTSWTRKDNDRSRGYVKSRSSESEVYDMRLQQDGTYGFPDGQS
ncbi:Putative DEAD-box ATP-dependent RNA helicase 33 [Linum perenne]